MPNAHPPESGRDVVRAAREDMVPMSQIAKDLGISDAILRKWLKRADVDEPAMASAGRCPFPISVLLFNRPDYARSTLTSLKYQTLGVAPDRLILSIDGYAGSKEEALESANRTDEVEAVARAIFPDATVMRAPRNLGIAQHYAFVEQQMFEEDGCDWALFFEEDFVLAPRYLEVVTGLIAYVDAEERIVQVSATGDTMSPRGRSANALYPMLHAWAFALRRAHYLERKRIVDDYLEALSCAPYFKRDDDAVVSRLVDFGIYPMGTSQDYVKKAIRKHLGRLAVTTERSYGRYIGRRGEHWTPEIFAELGYDKPPDVVDERTEFAGDISEFVPDLLRNDQQAWAREFDAVWKIRLRHALAEPTTRVTEAENRLADAVTLAAQAEDRASTAHARLMREEELLDASERWARSLMDSRSWRLATPLRSLSAGFKTIAGQGFRTRARAMAGSPWVPFEVRCRLRYWDMSRSWPTRHPVSLNQKVLWKMLKDRRPLLTTFADKVAVRDYVADKVGPEVLPQLYAVIKDPAELDPTRLPAEFVVKTSHASGLVWIVADRARLGCDSAHTERGSFATARDTLDWDQLLATCRDWLAINYADGNLEWAYRNIPPRILIEELLLGPDGRIPPDYKFLVFHGCVRLVEVHTDRFGDYRIGMVLPDWTPVAATGPNPPEHAPTRPDSLERMIHIAEAIGQETDFVRVDLYDIAGRIVFGELTSYPGAGTVIYSPESFDADLGRYWSIPRKYK